MVMGMAAKMEEQVDKQMAQQEDELSDINVSSSFS